MVKRLLLCFILLFSFLIQITAQIRGVVKDADTGEPISYLNVSVGTESGDVPFAISEGRNKEIQSEIPMEIKVSGNAHVEVSEGTIRTASNSEISENEMTELDIQGETVVFWSVEGDNNTIATCTITTEYEQYQYVMEMDGTNCKIKLKEKN